MPKDFLFEICSEQFVSGFEHVNGSKLKKYFEPYTDSLEEDKLGSHIFKSNGTNDTKIMLAAHIDEIGLMVTGILDGGFLSFTSVGGINAASLVAQDVTVYGKENLFGVIGIKPPHLTEKEEREKPLKLKDLFIDTGFSKEILEKKVSVGDIAVIKRTPVSLQGSIISSRQLDDKAGIAVMLVVARELKKISHKSNIYYACTAQEETGYRGSTTASYKINPDIGIVLDVGFGLTPEMPPDTALLGKGPAVAIGGRFNPKLTKKFIDVCKQYNYNFQYEASPGASGTDTEALQINMEGIPCILLSIPLRYMHTSVETIDVKDVETTGKAIARFINEIDNTDLEEILCFLKELTELSGVSGCEYEVRNFIKEKLNEIGCEYYIDKLGNVIAHNKGKKNKTIIVAAHMDEVGLLVSHIDSNGFIKFVAVGGIDQRVLNSKIVQGGEQKIPGVIGSKAVHLMSEEERGKAVPIDKLYIDIGSNSKEETEKLINIGDYVTFKSDYVEFGDNMIKAKALDDRAGCSAILELLMMKLDVDFYGVFTVMEEVGCRGAIAAAYKLEPDLGIVIEGTVCADMPEVEEHSKSTVIGKGAALSVMDNSTVYDIDEVRRVSKIAEENNILYQYRASASGGNDAGAIHKVKSGAKVVAISVPCRYIHSSVNVASKNDYNSVVALTKAVLLDQGK